MGFRPALTRILERLPKQRRTGLFSATQTREVKELARAGLRNPASVSVAVRAQPPQYVEDYADECIGDHLNKNNNTNFSRGGHSTVNSVMEKWGLQATPSSLTNYYAILKPSMKPLFLLRFLHQHRYEKVMVFFLTCAAVDFWERALRSLPRELISLAVEETSLSNENGDSSIESLCSHWGSVAQTGWKKQLRNEKLANKRKNKKTSVSDICTGNKQTNCPGNGLQILGLHGRMVQKKRLSVFTQFRGAKSALNGRGHTQKHLDGKVNDKTVDASVEQPDDSAPSSSSAHLNDEQKGAILLCTDVAARGLDVPDVDWIVQFDAPQEPAAFVHRVGRAGRAGRRGASLVLLDPKEDAYVEFLSLRKVPLCPYRSGGLDFETWWARAEALDDEEDEPNNSTRKGSAKKIIENSSSSSIKNIETFSASSSLSSSTMKVPPQSATLMFPARAASLQRAIRGVACVDRDLLERGSRAFMAHLRAYKEHRCEFIFRFKSLDVQSLANAFALVKLPKIPELRHLKLGSENTSIDYDPDIFHPLADFSTENIPYLDKTRERARQKRLVVAKEAFEAQKKLQNERTAVWRDQAAKLAKKNSTHEGEDKSRSTFDASSGSNKSRNIREDGPRKRKGKHEAIFDEWEELAREERLYKKLRKGKITQKQFDRGVKGGDIAEDSDIDMNEDSDEVQ